MKLSVQGNHPIDENIIIGRIIAITPNLTLPNLQPKNRPITRVMNVENANRSLGAPPNA